MKVYAGIDIGLSGAIAVITEDSQDVWDMPVLEIQRGKKVKREIDIPRLAECLRYQVAGRDVMVVVEDVHSRGGEGAVGAFSFGEAKGIVKGLLVALAIPYTMVAPATWTRKMMSGAGGGKDASRLRAGQIFPNMAPVLTRKKDDGRSDALLMAEYGRLVLGGGE